MTKALEFSGTVSDGKLPRQVSDQIATVLRQAEGKRVVVSIREQKRKRSNSQNAYLFGVVYQHILTAFREAGNSVDLDDVHLYCKLHVGKLKQVLVTPDGEVLRSVGSTAKLSTVEFSDYVEACRAWAAETLGINIPSPNEHAEEECAASRQS